MRRMIPVPSIDYVPSEMASGAGPLCETLDAQFEGWLGEAFGISDMRDPATVPAACLPAAGDMLAAGFNAGDPERVRRAKLASAAGANKTRGLWLSSVKPVVEARSGAEASLISGIGNDDFILAGTADEGTSTWSVMGGGIPGETFGIRIASGMSETTSAEAVAGTLLIDCGSQSLSAAEVNLMVMDLEDMIPSYYKAYVGYVLDGIFTAYPNGEVN